MISTIFADFTLEAAHALPNVPAGHKCGRLHGHTYQVRVELTGVVDPVTGFVLDYYEVEKAWREEVYAVLDHRLLNEIDGLENPTTEILLGWIWGRLLPRLPQLSRLEAREAMTMGVSYVGN